MQVFISNFVNADVILYTISGGGPRSDTMIKMFQVRIVIALLSMFMNTVGTWCIFTMLMHVV